MSGRRAGEGPRKSGERKNISAPGLPRRNNRGGREKMREGKERGKGKVRKKE